MYGYFCVVFKGKSLINYTNLFSQKNFKKIDKVILNYFSALNISMSEARMCNIKEVFPLLEKELRLRFSRIKALELQH